GARATGGRRAQPPAHPLDRRGRGRRARAGGRSVAAAAHSTNRSRVPAAERGTRSGRKSRALTLAAHLAAGACARASPPSGGDRLRAGRTYGRLPVGEPRAL